MLCLQILCQIGSPRLVSGKLIDPSTCLAHKDGDIPLVFYPRALPAIFPACSPNYSIRPARPAGKQ